MFIYGCLMLKVTRRKISDRKIPKKKRMLAVSSNKKEKTRKRMRKAVPARKKVHTRNHKP
jgi:hypothetical protein